MVYRAIWARRRLVARPTYSRSEAGRGHTLSLKLSGVITVVASGLRMSEPSLAKTLL